MTPTPRGWETQIDNWIDCGVEAGEEFPESARISLKRIVQHQIEESYKEGLTENIEALERTSEKYKTLFWCIRQDVIQHAVESYRKRIEKELVRLPVYYSEETPNTLISISSAVSIINK